MQVDSAREAGGCGVGFPIPRLASEVILRNFLLQVVLQWAVLSLLLSQALRLRLLRVPFTRP